MANTRPLDLGLSEVVGILSLATDLGTGLPLEHAIRTCLLSLELGHRVGLDASDLSDLYYLTLLRMLGCTADSHESAEYFFDEVAFGHDTQHLDYGDPQEFGRWVMESFAADQPSAVRQQMVAKMFTYTPEKRRAYLAGHCEVAQMLAARLGFGPPITAGLAYVYERWDGQGAPNQVAGVDQPLSARIMNLCNEIEIHHRIGGSQGAIRMAQRRSGGAFEPVLVDLFCGDAERILSVIEVRSSWDALLAAEPGRPRPLSPTALAEAGRVMADFADMKSVHTVHHSTRVADLVVGAGQATGLGDADLASLRLAAFAHDLGRVTVTAAIWDKDSTLSESEWEKVRLHPYYSERILGRAQGLASVAGVAGMHHERLDGSGYHRAAQAISQSAAARLLAAADSYQAMCENRAHRSALEPDAAAPELRGEAEAGPLDVEAVQAVPAAPGHRAGPIPRPCAARLT